MGRVDEEAVISACSRPPDAAKPTVEGVVRVVAAVVVPGTAHGEDVAGLEGRHGARFQAHRQTGDVFHVDRLATTRGELCLHRDDFLPGDVAQAVDVVAAEPRDHATARTGSVE